MATQYHESNQLPDGIVLAHTLHGRLDESIVHSHTATVPGWGDLIQAPYDGIPYYEDVEPTAHIPTQPDEESVELRPPRAEGREKRCHAKDDTCKGWAIGGSDFCAAHAGVFRPKTPGGRGTMEWPDSTVLPEGDPEGQ